MDTFETLDGDELSESLKDSEERYRTAAVQANAKGAEIAGSTDSETPEEAIVLGVIGEKLNNVANAAHEAREALSKIDS